MSHTVVPIIRSTLIDALRRRDLSVVAIFMLALLILLAAARVVGLERPAAGTFLLNLALTLATFGAHLIALLISARQLPEEWENRTLYPLLARPVARGTVVLGKWTGATIMGTGLFFGLLIPVWILVPQLEFYDPRTLAQLIALQPLALMCSAAIPILCTLYLPRALAVATALVVVFGTGHLVRWAERFPAIYLLPNPLRLNLVLRYTDGIGPLPAGQFIGLALAAILWTSAILIQSILRFERKAL